MGDRTNEEWGRVAVGLPGWRWMPGMLGRAGSLGQLTVRLRCGDEGHVAPDVWPNPDDPGTAGCLLALLGPTPSEGYMAHVLPPSSAVTKWRIHMNTAQTGPLSAYGSTLGRACIAAAEAIGRWPGPA